MSDKQKYLDRLNDDELKIVAGGGYVERTFNVICQSCGCIGSDLSENQAINLMNTHSSSTGHVCSKEVN